MCMGVVSLGLPYSLVIDSWMYCDRTLWIEPIATGRHGEYISVMNPKAGRSES